MTTPKRLSDFEDILDVIDSSGLLVPDSDLDEALRAEGVNVERLTARLQALTVTPAAKQPANVIFPNWVKNWSPELAAASAASPDDALIIVQPQGGTGEIELRIIPHHSGKGGGMVEIAWHTDEYFEGGLWLDVYRKTDDKPAYSEALGTINEGTTMLTEAQLGFDPVMTAVAFVLRVGDEPG